MARVEISLLGPFIVTVDGHAAGEFESETARALLAHLAAEPDRSRSRAAIAEMLWPGRPPGAALKNLRHTLSSLHHSLGGDDDDDGRVIRADRSRLALSPSSNVMVDLGEVERLAAVPDTDPRAIQAWEQAVRRFRGPFLDDVDPRAGPEWDEWLVTVRERTRQLHAQLLRRLAECREREGDVEEALTRARQLVELDPWDERAHRMVMRLHACAGEPAAALAHVDALRRRLRAELDVDPDAETIELEDAIRAGRLPAVLDAAPVPAFLDDVPPVPSGQPFVGRHDEVGWLLERAAEAFRGTGQVVFLAGEAGSGKTMLAAELARQAQEAWPELLVAWGRCSAAAGVGDPYLPFREILEALTGAGEGTWASGAVTTTQARRLWAAGPETTRLLVELGPHLVGTFLSGEGLIARTRVAAPDAPWLDRLDTVVAAAAAPPLGGRPQEALFDELTKVLAAVAARRPLLLVVDDLQWADAGSTGLLFHLGRRLVGHPILVVGALRPDELAAAAAAERPPMASIVNELRVLQGDCLRHVGGSRDFVDALLDAEPSSLDEPFRARLFRETGGLPLFTVELVRSMRDRGDLRRDAAGSWVVAPDVDWSRLPSRLEAAIAERIAWLPESLQHDLEVASVQGESFVAEVVAEVRGLAVPEVAARLGREAGSPAGVIEAGAVQRVGDRLVSRHSFRHGLFQRYLYQHLDEGERVRLHEATGVAVEALYSGRADAPVVELAHQFESARLYPQAVRYLGDAGRRALAMSAAAEAIALLDRALTLLENLAEGPERTAEELTLLVPLGIAWQMAGGYGAPQADLALQRAQALCDRLDPSPLTAVVLAGLAAFAGMRGRYADGEALARRVLTIAEATGDAVLEVLGRGGLSFHLCLQGHLAEAVEHGERAIALHDPVAHAWLAQAIGEDYGVVARGWTAVALSALGLSGRAVELGDAAVTTARRGAQPATLCSALAIGGCIPRLVLGEYEAARTNVGELHEVSSREHLPFWRTAAAIYDGVIECHLGDPAVGLVAVEQGLAAWRAMGVDSFASIYLGLSADATLRTGDERRMLASLDEALDRVRRTGEAIGEPMLLLRRAELLAALDEPGAAETALRDALDASRVMEARTFEVQIAARLVELLAGQGRGDEGSRVVEAVLGSCTEGLGSSHLRAARALLDGT